jgi:hypothetical protein
MDVDENESGTSVMLRIFAEDGSALNDAPILIPFTTSIDELQGLCNQLLNQEEDNQLPIQFQTVDGVEIVESIKASVPAESIDNEKVCLDSYDVSNLIFRVCQLSTCHKHYSVFDPLPDVLRVCLVINSLLCQFSSLQTEGNF